MVQVICNILGWLSWVAFAVVGWQTLLTLIASFRRRAQLLVKQQMFALTIVSELNNRRASVPKDQLPQQRRELSCAVRRLVSAMIHDLESGRLAEARRRLEQWVQELYFNADAVFVYASLATRLGLFGTVIGIIKWFGGTTLHSPESISAVGFALSTTALGLVLATSIEMSVSRIFEPAWQELRAAADNSFQQLETAILASAPHGVPATGRKLRKKTRPVESKASDAIPVALKFDAPAKQKPSELIQSTTTQEKIDESENNSAAGE